MMKESRNLLEVTIEVCEELKLMYSYITKIVKILKECSRDNGEMTKELYELGIEFYTQDFKYLEEYHEEISGILEQIIGRKFEYEETLNFFEEYSNQINEVFTFIRIKD